MSNSSQQHHWPRTGKGESVLRECLDTPRQQNTAVDSEAFTRIIAHDLREPLRTAHNQLTLLENCTGDSLEAADAALLTNAQANIERMQEMITGLFRYARIGSDEQTFESIDCNEVVAGVLETLRFDIEDRKATVTVDALPTVWGVEQLLRCVFQNLLTNALKYAGDDPPKIHVSAARTGSEWTFTIRDEGIGIESAVLERVFDPFVRANRSSSTPGTGMGLPICEKIVDIHGGSIGIDSRLGVGTTVTFTVAAQ